MLVEGKFYSSNIITSNIYFSQQYNFLFNIQNVI